MVVRLDCGFGNQLFQVAMGEWLCRRFGRPVIYDATGLAGSGRAALPVALCGDAPVATNRSGLGWRRAYWLGGKYNALLLKMVRATGLGRTPILFLDDEGNGDCAPVPTKPPVWAVGFWQNVTFVDAEVLDVMDRRLAALAQADGAGLEGDDEGVAVHLRWGDYKLDERNRRRHGLLGPGYFRSALAALGADRPVTVFSETPDAADWFASHCRKTDVRYAGQCDMWKDFFGLSRFRRIVIANSSFSWWAAAHRVATGKSVVMPARWFALDERWGRNASRRLRREGWIQVENDWL